MLRRMRMTSGENCLFCSKLMASGQMSHLKIDAPVDVAQVDVERPSQALAADAPVYGAAQHAVRLHCVRRCQRLACRDTLTRQHTTPRTRSFSYLNTSVVSGFFQVCCQTCCTAP
jgi:hypothetical protein